MMFFEEHGAARPRQPRAGSLLTLEQVTHQHIELVLFMSQGNLSQAASILDVNRRTLQRHIRSEQEKAGYNARQEATMAAKKKTVAGKTSAKPTKKKPAAPHGVKKDGTPKKKPGKPAAK
jgi:transcriptional regulator with GAF, ATPase, and Fis domain